MCIISFHPRVFTGERETVRQMNGKRVCERLPSELTLFLSLSSQSRTKRSDSGSMKVTTSPSMLQQRITEIDQQREELKIEVRNQSLINVFLNVSSANQASYSMVKA